jgi:hypothetical protein
MTETMTVVQEAAKNAVRTFVDAWNRPEGSDPQTPRDPALVAVLLSDAAAGFEWFDKRLDLSLTTVDQVTALVEAWLTAFPDLTVAVAEEPEYSTEGNFEGGCLQLTGTHTGLLRLGGMELAPTGASINLVTRFSGDTDEEGKISWFNTNIDIAELRDQLFAAAPTAE